MIALINGLTIFLSTLALGYFYGHSVNPRCMQPKVDEKILKKCGDYRLIAGLFETIILIGYIIFYDVKIPRSVYLFNQTMIPLTLLIILLVLSILLYIKALKDAGSETLKPKIDSPMFEGIYKNIRHPQTTATILFYFAIAIGSNQLFLVLYTILLSLIYIYITYLEEDDLLIKYGDDYRKYREKTGRFIPKLRK
ncbi:MAG: methyltransferase family protein [Candidatus Izemoplasmataceae bacterium]